MYRGQTNQESSRLREPSLPPPAPGVAALRPAHLFIL